MKKIKEKIREYKTGETYLYWLSGKTAIGRVIEKTVRKLIRSSNCSKGAAFQEKTEEYF